MEKIKEMSIDLETYSDVDIKKSGVYKYAESENFEILLFAVSINGGDVIVYDLACGDVLPDEILDAIVSDDIIKWAFNASFERICLSYWMKRNYPDRFCSYSIPEDTVGNYLNPASWRCTMIWSAYMGLPLSLEGVGAVLGLKDQKMKEGKDLIRYFCVPCKPTKSNGGRTRNLPMHAPEKWSVFKSYNKRDVEVEMGIKDKLHKFPVPNFVWDEYHLDQQINDRGILVDLQMVDNAITFGIDMNGKKDVLGMYVGENESAKFWLSIMNGLKNRGVEDILIACVDGLNGFPQAIEAVYPKTEIQQCIIHQIRNSKKFVSYKDIKKLMADLKLVYAAPTEETALNELELFKDKWDSKYPKIYKSWHDNWATLSTYFKYPEAVRRLIYTTNAIEGFNRQLRKVTKSKAVFPSDDSLLKMLYLATMDITKKWTGHRQDWGQIHSQLEIYFEERLAGRNL